MTFKTRVKKAKEQATKALKAAGIEDHFIVKVKKVKEDWLGLYRHRSQFSSKPIMWINQNLPAMAREAGVTDRFDEMLVDTILHEYGHIIYEFAELRGRPTWMNNPTARHLWRDIRSLQKGPKFEEEVFAETMARFLKGEPTRKAYRGIAQRYAECVSDGVAHLTVDLESVHQRSTYPEAPVQTTPAAEVIQEFWGEVAQIGWSTKTTDHSRIKRTLLKTWTPEKSETMGEVFREVKHLLYKACDKHVKGTGDDGFDDLLSHIIGLGKEEYCRVMENPSLAQERADKGSYKESFAYCLPYASDYAMLDTKHYVERAKRIVSGLEEGLKDNRFEPVFPKIRELAQVFAPALKGDVGVTVGCEREALELHGIIAERADWLWKDQCRNGTHFACSAVVANFFNDARRYLEY